MSLVGELFYSYRFRAVERPPITCGISPLGVTVARLWPMMPQSPANNRRERRAPKPIDAARLDEMALAYAARFAVSAARLAAYLRRKLRERGWVGEGEPPVEVIVARFVAAGYVDDAAYARTKTGSMLRRGLGPRRVRMALDAAGISEQDRAESRPAEIEARRAALAFARKRRLGPYGSPPADRQMRERQIAAMLRAGHNLDSARNLVDATSTDTAEQWCEAAGD
jgi:regulatory protein